MLISQTVSAPPVSNEFLDEKTRIYLAILALRQPFYMQISASPTALFEKLEDKWPVVDGWEYHASELQFHIRSLAEPLLESAPDDQLRLAINVAQTPQSPLPSPDAAAVHAVFDADHGTITHRMYSESQMPFDPTLDDVSFGMALLYQKTPQDHGDFFGVDFVKPSTLVPGSDLQLHRLNEIAEYERTGARPQFIMPHSDLMPDMDTSAETTDN